MKNFMYFLCTFSISEFTYSRVAEADTWVGPATGGDGIFIFLGVLFAYCLWAKYLNGDRYDPENGFYIWAGWIYLASILLFIIIFPPLWLACLIPFIALFWFNKSKWLEK